MRVLRTMLLAIMMVVAASALTTPTVSAHTVTRQMCLQFGRAHPPHQYRQYQRCMRWAKQHNAQHQRPWFAGTALATWYGPGFYGHTLAGGGTLYTNTWGVAHRTMGFRTVCTFSFHGRVARRVPVIDRGPYSGATFDLTGAVATDLHFSGAQDVRYTCR